MNWGEPAILQGLWALPVLVLGVVIALRKRRAALDALGPLLADGVGPIAAKQHRLRLGLLGVAMAGILLSLAQPQWGFRWAEMKQKGLNIVVVLDTSLSMAAQDVSPSRMMRAQREVFDLADLLAGDRVGLVVFAGGAYPRMPLTLDYGALRTLVRRSDTSTLVSQGSNMGAAIDEAVTLLGPKEESDRAIIVISDGEEQSDGAAAAAQRAIEAGVHIYAIGIGTSDGAPIPMAEGGFKKDGGEVVLTRLNEDSLQRVASIGKGAYVQSVAGTADVRGIYVDEIRGKLHGAEQTARREKIWEERFQWPLGIGLLLAMGAFVVGGRRRHAAAALLLLIPLAGGGEAWAGDDLDALVAEQIANPDDLELAERVGGALFQAERFNEAEQVLQTVADRTTEDEIRTRARYNAGLSAYKAGRLSTALESWQRVLQDTPEHPAAKKNAEAVQREIQKRTGEEPPPSDGDGDGESEEQDQQQDGGDTGGGDDGTREPTEPEQDTGGGGENQGEEESEPTGADTGEAARAVPPGAISEQEAERMFDGVEEGTPRVVIDPGSQGGKDW